MKWGSSYSIISKRGGLLCKIYSNKYRRKLKPILPFSLLANCKEILKLGFRIYKKSYFEKSLDVKKLRKGDV